MSGEARGEPRCRGLSIRIPATMTGCALTAWTSSGGRFGPADPVDRADLVGLAVPVDPAVSVRVDAPRPSVAVNLTGFAAAVAVSAGLSGLTVGIAAASEQAPRFSRSVLASPRPTDIGWSWDWDDDDEDWSQTASWDCPAGCSITFEDW